MTRKYGLHKYLPFGFAWLLSWLIVSIFTSRTQAQQSNIVPDNTLGAKSSQVIGNFQGLPREVITGGAIRQINLFHSFKEFNVSAGREAYFLSPSADIQNIFARVTGANRSEILGRLGTSGSSNPNLFLINPNGIIFGQNASLDVQGSFMGTTANGVQFGNQGNFSATNPQEVPLLTINPSALLFSQQQSRAISANQSSLSVAPGKNLALIGGDISLNGSTLQASGGQLELAAVAGKGTVGINADSSLSLPDNLARANINISNSLINVAANNAGSITINAGNLDISRSTVQAGIYDGLGTINSQAGDITINTTGKLQIAPQSFIRNWVGYNAIGKGGDIRINTDSMSVTNGSISTSTGGKDDAGSVVIKANNDIALNASRIFSTVVRGAEGNAGNVKIEARDSIFFDDAIILNSAGGTTGNAGNIFISADNLISLNNRAIITNQVEKGSNGAGGDIRINTGSLTLTNISGIQARTDGQGNAGNVIINARDRIVVKDGISDEERSGIFNVAGFGSKANAGIIEITTGSLEVTNRALINTIALGQGNAGNITINADNIWFDDTAAVTRVGKDVVGNSGNIKVKTGTLRLTNGGQIDTSTFGKGNSGNLTVNARNILIDGISADGTRPSSLFTEVVAGAEGNGGDLRISTGTLTVTNGGKLEASTRDKGNAGNIFVTADRILFDGRNPINSSGAFSPIKPKGFGQGGNIQFDTNFLAVTNGAQIGANTEGTGNAGNITINAKESVLFATNGTALSNVAPKAVGNGGNIVINTGFLDVLSEGQLITSTFGSGNAGNITINASEKVTFAGRNPNYDQFATTAASSVYKGGIGNAGDVKITSKSVSVTNDAVISSETQGQGNAGSVIINASDVLVDNSSVTSRVGANGVGKGGNIEVKTGTLDLTNEAILSANTFNKGNAGDIFIDASDRILVDNSAVQSRVGANGVGNGGNIKVKTRTLDLTNGATLNADTFKEGDAGDIFIDASDRVNLNRSGVSTSVESSAKGNGGDILINTRELSITNNSIVDTSTSGQGNAGNLTINASKRVFLDAITNKPEFSGTTLSSTVRRRGRGRGGDIRINTGELFIANGAQIDATTFGQGDAGNLQINAQDSVTVSGTDPLRGFASALFTSTETNFKGKGGNITVDTGIFRVIDGATVDARTLNSSDAGNITINAGLVEVLNSGQIISSSSGSGRAGKITVNATDRVVVNGTDAKFNERLDKFPGRFSNFDSASGFFVLSSGSGIAGDIEVTSPAITLDNKGKLIAESSSGNGGNINLQATDLLLLRRGSQISTTAGLAKSGGNGGNININAKFIVAIPKENSDISANAFLGSGGNIEINSQGIFGIEARLKPTEKSDITASSELGVSGVINIKAPDTSSIINSFAEIFPTIDTNALIADSCIARGDKRQENSFFITGSGAITPNRPGVMVSNYTTGEVRGVEPSRPWKKGDPIIEATGVYRLSNGQILLSRECSN